MARYHFCTMFAPYLFDLSGNGKPFRFQIFIYKYDENKPKTDIMKPIEYHLLDIGRNIKLLC